MDPDREAALRRSRFSSSSPEYGEYVALLSGAVVGFVAVGGYRHEDSPGPSAGEVFAVYVLASAQGVGVGRALMDVGVGHLRGHGLAPALLWVLSDNAPARAFYERYGFRPDGTEHLYEGTGVPLPEVRYRLGRV